MNKAAKGTEIWRVRRIGIGCWLTKEGDAIPYEPEDGPL